MDGYRGKNDMEKWRVVPDRLIGNIIMEGNRTIATSVNSDAQSIADAHNATLEDANVKQSILDEEWFHESNFHDKNGVIRYANSHQVFYDKYKQEIAALPDALRVLVKIRGDMPAWDGENYLIPDAIMGDVDAVLKKAGIE
jgi:hypothetical protein